LRFTKAELGFTGKYLPHRNASVSVAQLFLTPAEKRQVIHKTVIWVKP
jgi:hypothetical protein